VTRHPRVNYRTVTHVTHYLSIRLIPFRTPLSAVTVGAIKDVSKWNFTRSKMVALCKRQAFHPGRIVEQ
jgi:hypothetical protein